jgi:hypothetical protein
LSARSLRAYRLDHRTDVPDDQETNMLWPASIDLQRPTPRSAAVATSAGQSGFLVRSTMNHEYRRWRS